MLERIYTLLKRLEWSANVYLVPGSSESGCPMCRASKLSRPEHYAECELKARLDELAPTGNALDAVRRLLPFVEEDFVWESLESGEESERKSAIAAGRAVIANAEEE